MAAATARAPQPAKAKSRPGTGRLITLHVNNGVPGNISGALRLQRLGLLGIIGQRAALLADIAWGEVHNG